MKTALKAGAYATPVILSAAVPAAVLAANSVLPVTGTLTGTVTLAATSGVVSGATVSIVSGPGAGLSATTAANGTFSIPNVPVGTQSVQTVSPGTFRRTDTVTITQNAVTNIALPLNLPPASVSAMQSNPTATGITETVSVSLVNNLRNFTFNVYIRPNNSTDPSGIFLRVGTFTTDASGNGAFTGTAVYTPTSGGTPTSATVLVGTVDSTGSITSYYRIILSFGAGLSAVSANASGTFDSVTSPDTSATSK